MRGYDRSDDMDNGLLTSSVSETHLSCPHVPCPPPGQMVPVMTIATTNSKYFLKMIQFHEFDSQLLAKRLKFLMIRNGSWHFLLCDNV